MPIYIFLFFMRHKIIGEISNKIEHIYKYNIFFFLSLVLLSYVMGNFNLSAIVFVICFVYKYVKITS